MGRKAVEEAVAKKDDSDSHDDHKDSFGGTDEERPQGEGPDGGALILDAVCAPQAMRFPTDASLQVEARNNTERSIDAFHKAGFKDIPTYERSIL